MGSDPESMTDSTGMCSQGYFLMNSLTSFLDHAADQIDYVV